MIVQLLRDIRSKPLTYKPLPLSKLNMELFKGSFIRWLLMTYIDETLACKRWKNETYTFKVLFHHSTRLPGRLLHCTMYMYSCISYIWNIRACTSNIFQKEYLWCKYCKYSCISQLQQRFQLNALLSEIAFYANIWHIYMYHSVTLKAHFT